MATSETSIELQTVQLGETVALVHDVCATFCVVGMTMEAPKRPTLAFGLLVELARRKTCRGMSKKGIVTVRASTANDARLRRRPILIVFEQRDWQTVDGGASFWSTFDELVGAWSGPRTEPPRAATTIPSEGRRDRKIHRLAKARRAAQRIVQHHPRSDHTTACKTCNQPTGRQGGSVRAGEDSAARVTSRRYRDHADERSVQLKAGPHPIRGRRAAWPSIACPAKPGGDTARRRGNASSIEWKRTPRIAGVAADSAVRQHRATRGSAGMARRAPNTRNDPRDLMGLIAERRNINSGRAAVPGACLGLVQLEAK
jgi:hypothetical protein